MSLTPPPSAPPAAPTAAPDAPQRSNPGTFRALADSFLGWLVGFRTSVASLRDWLATYITWAGTHVTEMQALQDDVAAKQLAAAGNASSAASSASAASVSESGANASREAIDNRLYPGTYAADPTTRPDGTAPQNGDQHTTTAGIVKSYLSGVWSGVNVNMPALAAPGGASLVGGTWFGGVVATVAQLATSIGASLIGVIQAGVGAVLRSIQDKLRDTVSVKDFGAKLDGTDDAAALRLAFTFCNGKGLRVSVPGPSCLIGSSIDLSNFTNMTIDWGCCNVTYSGGAGTYLFDMTQAGNVQQLGGIFTGSGANHFVKTKGSAAAQATVYPTVPADNQWTREVEFRPISVTGFATVFDLQNFTREVKIGGNITGNVTSVKTTGKVVNVSALPGTVLYSSLAASQSLVVRGDAGDTAWRYAEGLLFPDVIMDTVGAACDVQDVFMLDISGSQLRSASGGDVLKVTKGITPLTRTVKVRGAVFNGTLNIGAGLLAAFDFDFQGSDLTFDSAQGTAITVGAYTKGVAIRGARFLNGTNTPRMFSVGANCADISLRGLAPDAVTYTNPFLIDPTSIGAVDGDMKADFVPDLQFGGANTGITYASRYGRYQWQGGFIMGVCGFTLTSKGTAVGAATIGGLPFRAASPGAASVGKFSSMNTAWSPVVGVDTNATALEILNGNSGSVSGFTNADFSNGSLVELSFCYPVS